MYAQQGGVREHRFFLRMAENQAGTNRPAGLCRHARARRDIPAMTRYLRRSYQSAYLSAISASSCPYQSSDTVSFVVMSCSDRLAFSIASLPHLTLHSLHHTEVPIALTALQSLQAEIPPAVGIQKVFAWAPRRHNFYTYLMSSDESVHGSTGLHTLAGNCFMNDLLVCSLQQNFPHHQQGLPDGLKGA